MKRICDKDYEFLHLIEGPGEGLGEEDGSQRCGAFTGMSNEYT